MELRMQNQTEPVVLELAPLPRDKIGPFLLLGLEKDADKEQIESNWARRVIWARKNQLGVPLESINWAREVVTDPEKRIRADVTSLNADLTDRVIDRLEKTYGLTGAGASQPELRDAERPLADYTPAVEIPDAATVRASIHLPQVPEEVPAVTTFLLKWVGEPLDPWALELP